MRNANSTVGANLGGGVSEGQRRYGNARPTQRITAFRGLPVNVEIEAGEHVVGPGWEKTYLYPYGEIRGTHALSDGDPVDVYLGPNPQGDAVFVVHQGHRDGTYDEDKCFLGFASERDAVAAYFLHGPEWGFMSVDRMTFDQFEQGYLAGQRAEMKGGGE